MREEIEQFGDGWVSSLDKLPLLDSFLRESARLNPSDSSECLPRGSQCLGSAVLVLLTDALKSQYRSVGKFSAPTPSRMARDLSWETGLAFHNVLC